MVTNAGQRRPHVGPPLRGGYAPKPTGTDRGANAGRVIRLCSQWPKIQYLTSIDLKASSVGNLESPYQFGNKTVNGNFQPKVVVPWPFGLRQVFDITRVRVVRVR